MTLTQFFVTVYKNFKDWNTELKFKCILTNSRCFVKQNKELVKMTEREKERYEQYKLAYAAFIAVYPFMLEDLEGEIWADIEGYDGDYQESNYGRTKSLKFGKEKILRPALHKKGYLYVALSKKGKMKIFKVHRLVAKCFISNPQNLPEVNHKFGVKFDNYFENIEWTTHLKNVEHSVKMGLQKTGAERHNSKLTKEQILYIREHLIPYDTEFGGAALSRKFNVAESTIWDIVNFKKYRNVK